MSSKFDFDPTKETEEQYKARTKKKADIVGGVAATGLIAGAGLFAIPAIKEQRRNRFNRLTPMQKDAVRTERFAKDVLKKSPKNPLSQKQYAAAKRRVARLVPAEPVFAKTRQQIKTMGKILLRRK